MLGSSVMVSGGSFSRSATTYESSIWRRGYQLVVKGRLPKCAPNKLSPNKITRPTTIIDYREAECKDESVIKLQDKTVDTPRTHGVAL
eukprot:scaffold116543_cov28-Tisochrysis_lutea.AAC.3